MSHKSRLFIVTLFTVAVIGTTVRGDTPEIFITNPTTGSSIFGVFPNYASEISFDITHVNPGGNLDSLKDLLVTAQETGDLSPTTVFQSVDLFPCPGVLPAGLLACSAADAGHGSMTVRWVIPSPGVYTIVVQATHGSSDGSDTETNIMAIETVSAEYPAPPAVANAYINGLSSTTRKLFAAGARGCVISQIAQNHGQDNKYNPPPGPYNVAWIQADVRAYSQGCGGPYIPEP